ncbi:MAG: family 78 glycoside hydrolase catalytic domain [Clostridia bacterium]|nr:family 78 glycoside hydrolase catalytic domain [Clostridia bacterium]
MQLSIVRIFVDYDMRPLVLTDRSHPVFSWALAGGGKGAAQKSYRIRVLSDRGEVYDSTQIEETKQSAVYAGAPLVSGETYRVCLSVRDTSGECAEREAKFSYLAPRFFFADWITASDDFDGEAKHFFRSFSLDKLPTRATLYASGIGYQYITVNGVPVEKSFLNPATSAYHKLRYYTVTDITDALCLGKNGIFAVVGDGWRSPCGGLGSVWENKAILNFVGETALIAELELEFESGETVLIKTDGTWLCGLGATGKNSLFDGEFYDASRLPVGWDTPEFDGAGFSPAVRAESMEDFVLLPQTHPPVTEQRRISARSVYPLADGSYIFDFGENVAGVGCLSIPKDVQKGTVISVEYAEDRAPNGDLCKETLRGVLQTDTYICGENNLEYFIPRLCYHGFRYAKLTGYPTVPSEETLVAVVFHNDIKNRSHFRCGNPLVNQLQENIVRTEADNLHHVATDCPQRNERMGWLNDATVRFEETPYNFYTDRLFRKILLDIVTEQDASGAIPDTVPFIGGHLPSDPVCSSFLVMGLENLLHYGDTETVREYYEAFKSYNESLAALVNEEGIITFSHYGDWAGPDDFCTVRFDGPHSAVTPNALMSTGFHYYNYMLLSRFALVIGNEAESEKMLADAERVRAAFLEKWFDSTHGYVATGSQGAQAFALWLGILPKESVPLAAKRMHEAVKNVGYRLTTGNITTKYLMDMLAVHGYADDAWRLLTREEYPSWGYMIANGATTIWERFEHKFGSGMNSHNHPMYGAVGYFMYAHLLGIRPLECGFARFTVDPVYPEGLLFAEGRVDTLMGEIYIKWERRDERIYLSLAVPFGMTAEVKLPNGPKALPHGTYCFDFEENEK